MNDKIELAKSDLVRLFDAVIPYQCTSFLPGEPIPPRFVPPDPEACQHWIEALTAIGLAEQAVERAVNRQQIGDALAGGGAEALLASSRSDIVQFVDDFCGTPPRWPLPWPPPDGRLVMNPEGLPPGALVAAGVRFQAAADHLQAHPLQAEFSAAADRLFDVAISRLARG